MKALIINAPGDFRICDITKPSCPSNGILLKVLACGLCGSDLRTIRAGHSRVKFPFTIGHEVSGVVAETGNAYDGPWKSGDKLAVSPVIYCGKCVFCQDGSYELCTGYKELAQHWQGGFAEYMPVPPEAIMNGSIQIIPEGADPVHATIVEPLSSCINAQEKGNTGLGDTVVIIGAGPVGILHLELARARGAKEVIMADISPNRIEMLKAFNPDHIINPDKINLVERVLEITKGYGADVIITANSIPETQVQAIEMAKKGGRILLFGGLPKDNSCPHIDMNLIHYKALHLIGTTIFSPRHNRLAMNLVASGRISAGKIITHVMPLMKFEEGVEIAMRGMAGKIVFVP